MITMRGVRSIVCCPLLLAWLNSDAMSFLPTRTSRRRHLLLPFALPSEYYFEGSYNSDHHNANQNTTEFLKALCIVPPEENWDRLQRARHYARDPLFHEWPPAIRLFHPFSGTALDVAQVVEDLEIEPFEISFDTWVIVPHMEALQAEWRNAETVPSVENVNQYTNQYEEEDQKVRELIAREEKLGQEKSRARQIKREQEGAIPKSPPYTAPPVKEKETKSPSEVLEEQKLQYEEFGGPCILCLEPDQETKEKLCEIREALAEILDHDTYSSPSSVYSWNFVQDFETDYRPLIPISSFESIQSALDVARRLKGLWGDPLSWEVKDLHLISCRDDGEEDWEASSSPQSMMEWNKEPWALNARIMLMGEEIEQDKHFNEQIVMKLVEEGEAGGLDISMDFTVLDDDEEELSAIEQYLDDDEDWDEGTQVVIGRTHFYTGDQGTYRGMPASSVVDAKDRSLGEGGVVSGLARRRRTSSRQGSLWAEGEFGRRGSDYLPWNKREKPKKLANLEGLSDSFSGMYGIDDDNEDDNEDDGGDNDNEDDNDGGGDNDNEDGDGDEKLIT